MNRKRAAVLAGACLAAATTLLPSAAGGMQANVSDARPVTSHGLVAQVSRGDRIAFTRDGAIYTMNVSGRRLRRLGSGTDPSWSPNGRQIAFVETGSDGSLAWMATDGRDGWHSLGVSGDEPAWSPDGQWLAYGGWGIFLVDLHGRVVKQLTTSLSDTEGCDCSPAWSPDGRQIVFGRVDDIGGRGLWVVDSDGRNLRRLSRVSAPSVYSDQDSPAWSPNGRRIAFTDRADVYEMGAGGRHVRRLTRGPALDSSPAWSPDGRRIVFSRYAVRGRNADLYVVDADGRHLTRLTRGPAVDTSPARFGAAPTRTTFEAMGQPVAKGAPVTLKGTVTKVGRALPAAKVVIQFRAEGTHRYVPVTTLRTGPAGRYRTMVRPRRSGMWRAVHPATRVTGASSATDRVTVVG